MDKYVFKCSDITYITYRITKIGVDLPNVCPDVDDANHQHLGQPLLSQAQAADKDT